MAITSVVPTGDSNIIKVTLKTPLGVSGTFLPHNAAPESIVPLLHIEGVEQLSIADAEVYITRDANLDWGSILDDLKRVLN